MDKALDTLIRQYNRNVRMLEHKSLRCRDRAYSTHEEVIKRIDQIGDEIMKLSDSVRSDVEAINKLEWAIEKNKNSDFVNGYYEQNKIISPHTYSKILAYYRKHKNRKHYDTYKVDRELHNFLMQIGKYLERENVRLVSSRGYSTAAEPSNEATTKMRDLLSNISEKLITIGGGITLAAHALYPVLGPLAIRLPKVRLLLGVVAVLDAITNVMIPLGAVIHPDRWANARKIVRTTRVKLGLYRDVGYSIYINYVYKLYDLLNSIMFHIKNIYVYLVNNQDLSINEIAENLKEKIERETGIKQKSNLFKLVLGFLSPLFKSKAKVKEGDILDINKDYLTQLVIQLDEKNDQLDKFGYVLKLSDAAIEKIKEYYGENIPVDDGTLKFDIKYSGGRYYRPVEVLDKSELYIHGARFNKDEASVLIAGCMALADELIITQIGKMEFEKGIIIINLGKLKWMVYTKRNLWERWLDVILKRRTERIDQNTIGFIIFESFNKLISSRVTEEEASEEENKEDK